MALFGCSYRRHDVPLITGDPTSRLCANTQNAALTYLIVNSSSASHGTTTNQASCFNSFCRAISLLSITAVFRFVPRFDSVAFVDTTFEFNAQSTGFCDDTIYRVKRVATFKSIAVEQTEAPISFVKRQGWRKKQQRRK